MISTACPLDCYDACGIVCDESYPDRLVADPAHPSYNASLCSVLHKHIHETQRLTKPTIDGTEVSMSKALDAVADAMREDPGLLWRGVGHMGYMQSVTQVLIGRIGGTLTHGSLCDSAGQAAIEAGRGYHHQLPLEQISDAEVIVVWGRNLTVTNKHIVPLIQDKKIIVIDPVRTEIAKKADLFLQIKPRSDIYLAILLSRFSMMEGGEDSEWLDEFAPDWDEFYEFTQEFRIKSMLQYMDLSLNDLGDMLYMIQNHKTVFLVGIAPQHYSIGNMTIRAIDSLAAVLGLFGREGSGVHFMGNSFAGFDNPLDVSARRVSSVDTPFDRFKTVLVQGGNPAESMPNSTQVIERLSRVKNLIYFGLYPNQTSQLARITIPAKNFLAKEDLRMSYGHYCVQPMHKVIDSDSGISEYEFVSEILERLGLDGLESEEYYLQEMIRQCSVKNHMLLSPAYRRVPYEDGFGIDGGDEFEFVDDLDDDQEPKELRKFRKAKKPKFDGRYWLLSPKAQHTINTQFVRKNRIYIHPEAGYQDKQMLRVISEYGEIELEVSLDENLRHDCVLIYSSTPGVNKLTPSTISDEGGGACYGDTKVRLEPI